VRRRERRRRRQHRRRPSRGAVYRRPAPVPNGAVHASGRLRCQRRRILQHRRRAQDRAVQRGTGQLRVHVQPGRVSVSIRGAMMNRLPSVLSLVLAISAAGVLTGTASHAAQATLRCPGTVQTGAQLVTEITVDVGAIPLGAYSLAVTPDPAVLAIESIEGGDSPQFAGAPTTNRGSVTSGSTNVSAFQT